MAAHFIDTSALVRRYDRSEPGAERVRTICRPLAANTVIISRLTPVEVASAFARKAREGVLDVPRHKLLWRSFLAHWRRQYSAVAVDDQVLLEAQRLVMMHGLRAYDAVQVGCAKRIATIVAAGSGEPLTFVTADRGQANAARAEGLDVELIS